MSIIETLLGIIERYKSLYQPSRDERNDCIEVGGCDDNKKWLPGRMIRKEWGWWDSVLARCRTVVSELTTRFLPILKRRQCDSTNRPFPIKKFLVSVGHLGGVKASSARGWSTQSKHTTTHVSCTRRGGSS